MSSYPGAAIFGTVRDPTWATPLWLLDAVRGILGEPVLDLAATVETSAAGSRWLGPGSPIAEDAFEIPWPEAVREATVTGAARPAPLWLNPPWSRMCLSCPGGHWTPRECSAAGHRSRDKLAWMARAMRLGTSLDDERRGEAYRGPWHTATARGQMGRDGVVVPI